MRFYFICDPLCLRESSEINEDSKEEHVANFYGIFVRGPHTPGVPPTTSTNSQTLLKKMKHICITHVQDYKQKQKKKQNKKKWGSISLFFAWEQANCICYRLGLRNNI